MAGPETHAAPPTTDDPDLQRWMDDMRAQKRSPYTVKHYALSVRLFERWLRDELAVDIPLRQAGPSDLKAYQIWLSTRKSYAKTTLYVTLKALQSFYRFLESDAADGLKAPRRNQGLPKYLTLAEAKRLLDAASAKPRDHAAIALLLYAGLRVGELCRFELQDVDYDEGTLRVRSGKGDKDRLVVLPQKALEILRNWLSGRPATASDFVFPGRSPDRPLTPMTMQRTVVRAARNAGLEKTVTPHVLRHTLATTLLRNGGDIRFIQRILGHASIATTQIYTHLDDAELKRMYERALPTY